MKSVKSVPKKLRYQVCFNSRKDVYPGRFSGQRRKEKRKDFKRSNKRGLHIRGSRTEMSPGI